jgi:hypothetical protein
MTPRELYILYCKMRTDADVIFHNFMYLQALGHSIGKNSTCNMIPDKEYHNLYILLVGDSFFGRKGVSQDLGMKLYPLDHILPNEFSPEQFIDILSKRPQSVLALGEFSKILKMCKSGKGYLAPIIELWNDLYRYNRPCYIRDTKNGGVVIVNEPYLSINSTCTEEVLKKYMEIEMLQGGFMGRFVVVPGKTTKRPRRLLPQIVPKLELFFRQYFLELNKFMCNHPVEFIFTEESFKRLNEIEDELYNETMITAVTGRYGQTIISLADLLAFDEYMSNISIISDISNVSDISDISCAEIGSPVDLFLQNFTNTTNFTNITNFTKIINVDVKFVDQAYEMIKPCINLVRKLKDYCESDVPVSKLREFMLKVENHRAKRSDFMKLCNMTKEDTNRAEDTMGNEGTRELIVIKVETVNSRGTRNKEMKVYCSRKFISTTKCNKCSIKEHCDEFVEV